MTETLTPQEPGAQGDALEALAAKNAPDIIAELDSLDPEQLSKLRAIEANDRERVTVIRAIDDALNGLEQTNAKVDASVPNVTGDAESYRDKRAADIDAAKLAGPVLTLDGWLCPSPKAEPQG